MITEEQRDRAEAVNFTQDNGLIYAYTESGRVPDTILVSGELLRLVERDRKATVPLGLINHARMGIRKRGDVIQIAVTNLTAVWKIVGYEESTDTYCAKLVKVFLWEPME